MAMCKKLKDFLESNHVPFTTIPHSPAYTAPHVAAAAHVSGRNVVKCVMVRADGANYMVATTANAKVDLEKIEKAVGAAGATLEREEDFKALFTDCDVGGMPPFGNLYGIPVIADEDLFDDEEIVFNGGDHATLVRMKFADFERLVRPIRADVTQKEIVT